MKLQYFPHSFHINFWNGRYFFMMMMISKLRTELIGEIFLSINEPWILLSSKSGVKLAIIRSWCDKTPPLCVLCSCFTLSIHGKLQTLIYCQNIYVILLNLHQYLCFDISTNRRITIRAFMFCGVASRVEHCTQPIACNDPLADVGRKIRTPMPAFAINSI